MKETHKNIPAIYAASRDHWRKWLAGHAASEVEVWLIIYHKKSPVPSITYPEAVEEALCFGWIDSVVNKRDAESVYQRFSVRKANSNWSASNVERVARLTAAGKMTAAGQKMIDIAKEKGKWPG